MGIYVDTCVLPRNRLETAQVYRERFGNGLGFEILMMFDMSEFEENFLKNIDFFAEGPLMFHEPVLGVDHAFPRGSTVWEEGMYHLRLTKKFAEVLHPPLMVYHLNNGQVIPEKKEEMLRNSLENLEEMREMFPDTRILVENTGTEIVGNLLLNQQEFTDVCRDRDLPVLIDVGHANANGWDVPKLIADLADRIGGFHLHNNDGMHDLHNRLREGTADYAKLVPCMDAKTPEAIRVIEYTRPVYHGEPLMEDIAYLQALSGK